jgi:hypothetical protein
MNLLGEILSVITKDIKGIINELHHGNQTITITVAKAYCTPARGIVYTALQPYGVKIYGYREYQRFTSPRAWLRAQGINSAEPNAQQLPLATFADVTVSNQAAAWAEYLLLRTGKFYVPGEYVNAKNAQWATQHGGQMPPQWDKGLPLIEKNCSIGKTLWCKVLNHNRKK